MMGRAINRLTARTVATAGPGMHADGNGLYLLVSDSGARSWIFRYQLKGRAREMGLGPASAFPLGEARVRAQMQRRLIADGIDPIDTRAAARATPSRTWGQAVADFIAAHKPGWRSESQARIWQQSLADHGPPQDLPVTAITTAVVLDALRKMWQDKTDTAARVRGRIERVWAAEKVAGQVSGENPARWRGHLDALLPAARKVTKPVHFRAMPYTELPAFWRELTMRRGLAAAALQFVILTAARTGEVTGMQWSEVDGDLWTVPAERMKSEREHSVPLSALAQSLLAGRRDAAQPWPLSENGMLFMLQRTPPRGMGRPYTVHGFRSAFRDWAAETTSYPSEVAEMALAHAIKDKTEAAYRRGELLAKRRQLMDAWAAYVTGGAVVRLVHTA